METTPLMNFAPADHIKYLRHLIRFAAYGIPCLASLNFLDNIPSVSVQHTLFYVLITSLVHHTKLAINPYTRVQHLALFLEGEKGKIDRETVSSLKG